MRTLAWAETPPATAGVVAERPRVREKELTGGTSPSATCREGREGGFSVRGPSVSGPACGPSSWAARSIFFFFLLCKFCFMFDFV